MLRLARLLVLLSLAAAPIAAPAVARADRPAPTDARSEAQLHLDRATELHRGGQLEEALRELTLAYSLDPRPDLLYAIAQVHVQLGQCPQAVLFYERFLSTSPDAVPAAAAAEAIDVCRNAPGSVAPAPAAPLPIAAPPPHHQPERRERWYADKLGGALLGAGVVLGAVAVVTYASARSDLDGAEDAADYQAHGDLVDRARGKRMLAVALGAGGAALTGLAIARYVLVRRGPARRGVGLAPASGGGLVTWSGRF